MLFEVFKMNCEKYNYLVVNPLSAKPLSEKCVFHLLKF